VLLSRRAVARQIRLFGSMGIFCPARALRRQNRLRRSRLSARNQHVDRNHDGKRKQQYIEDQQIVSD
jgi:hypothetical protein